MKLAVITDLPDYIDLSQVVGAKVSITWDDGEQIYEDVGDYVENVRPLPERKEYRLPDGKMDLNEASRYGWNKCLDAITGEKQ